MGDLRRKDSDAARQHALKHAQEEADTLLAAHAPREGLQKLLTSVVRLLADRPTDLSEVSEEIIGLVKFVEAAGVGEDVRSKAVRKSVAALAYLRNPYDRIFDLHVEGGFADDIAVIREAWTSLQKSGVQ